LKVAEKVFKEIREDYNLWSLKLFLQSKQKKI
jgi:hypothetical protein